MSPERLSIAEAQARLETVRADARAEAPADPTHGPAAQPDAQPAPKARSAQKRRKAARRAVPDRFGQFRSVIIGTPELSAPPRCLLSALVEHTDATTGSTFVSREKLAKELGITEGQVSVNLRILKAGGYVVIDEKAIPGASKSAVRRVTDPASWPKSKAALRERLEAAGVVKEKNAPGAGTSPTAGASAGGREALHGEPTAQG